MADWSGLLQSVFGTGGVVALWQGTRWGAAERKRRRVSRQREPLEQRSLEVRVADRAWQAQKRLVDGLSEDLEKLQLRFDAYKAKAERRQELSDQRLAEAQERIQEMGATIERLEFELDRYRAGT